MDPISMHNTPTKGESLAKHPESADEHTTRAHLTSRDKRLARVKRDWIAPATQIRTPFLCAAQERPVSPQRSTQSDYQNTSRVPVLKKQLEKLGGTSQVMIQYVNGADPSERCSRERMRYALRKMEKAEQVIMNMAIEALLSAEGALRTAETCTIVERIPRLSRLGSLHDQDTWMRSNQRVIEECPMYMHLMRKESLCYLGWELLKRRLSLLRLIHQE
ncbi:hypothetical protein Bca101_099924 [Brassica carinata]